MSKVVTFGEMMLRLSPAGYDRFVQSKQFNAFYGGSEANVAVSLASFGKEVSYVTKFPENNIDNYEDHLEFLSIKVPDGPLTSRLQHIKVGDTVIVGKKPTGTLLIDYLLPGKRLYLLSTGTGLAPFMSIIRDPQTYEAFEQVVLVHGVREKDELAYHDLVTEHLPQHEFLGEMIGKQLLYYPTVTRESYRTMGRVTDLMASGKMFEDLKLPALDAATDRVMICGSPGMLKDLKVMLEVRGFKEGTTSKPGDFVIERAFAEK